MLTACSRKCVTPLRLDRYLVEAGHIQSRHRAHIEIKHGRVRVNDHIVTKPAYSVKPNDTVTLDTLYNPYVSKGGLKLAHALKTFGITVDGTTILDVGASTGGFSDCALTHGATHVIAVDVGHNQLHPRLHHDDRITSYEKTNFLDLNPTLIAQADVLIIDVSFTSAVPLIIHAYDYFSGPTVWLLKPQFEHGAPPKNGVIKHPKDHQLAINKAFAALRPHRIQPQAITPSPLLGGSGNREFLVWLARGDCAVDIDVRNAVAQAHTIKG